MRWNIKTFVVVLGGLGALLLIGYLLAGPIAMFLSISQSMKSVRRLEQRLQKPEIFIPAATNLALYYQNRLELRLTNEIESENLPPPLPLLASPWAMFENNSVQVEFGGGFYHFGYELRLASSRDKTNLWEMYLYREEQDQKLLYQFPLADFAGESVADFESNSLATIESRIQASPREYSLYKDKIEFFAEYRPSDARAACSDAIAKIPNYWWPHLTLALIDATGGRIIKAQQELSAYVSRNPSYSRYIYLAYFYQRTGKPKEVASAIEKAISFPIVDQDDDDKNSECRGYSLGVYAFESHEYSTVLKLCDSLLLVKENGDYAKSALSDLRSAAQAALAGRNPQFSPNSAIARFDPYEKISSNLFSSKLDFSRP